MRIALSNASLLSVLYLALAVVIEALRRLFPDSGFDAAARTIERFPAGALRLFGLLQPLNALYHHLREAYVEVVPEAVVRLAYGITTVGIIFALGFLVAAGMWAVRAVWERRLQRKA